MTAALRTIASLTAVGGASTVSLTEAFARLKITILSATTTVLYIRSDGVTAVIDADECFTLAGASGATREITAGLNAKSVSVVATADCKIAIEKIA